MSATSVQQVSRAAELSRWNELVASSDEAGPMHWSGWKHVLEGCFAVRPRYLMAVAPSGETQGVLPLYESRSVLTGRHLATLAGGVLARTDEAREALVSHARALLEDSGRGYLLFRGGGEDVAGAERRTVVHTVTDLTDGAEQAWKRLSSNTRRKVRKAEKEGFTVEPRPGGMADELYPFFARRMRDLGTPTPGPCLFRGMERWLGPHLELLAVRHRGQLAGGMVMVRSGRRWTSLYVAIAPERMPRYPTYLLYWTALERACAAGAGELDWGRSVAGSGTHRFKQQFGRDREITYATVRPGGKAARRPALHRTDSVAQRVWSRLPLPVANVAGPVLRRQLPFV